MSVCTDGCKHIGPWSYISAEQLEKFPNLDAKQAIKAARCKNPSLVGNKDVEMYETADGKCYCGSALAQVLLRDCKGFQKEIL